MNKTLSVSRKLFFIVIPSMIFLSFAVSDTSEPAHLRAQVPVPLAGLEQRFAKIPDSVQTSVYWYWSSDNISEDGVIRDLEAMKKVGINRAFIGNVFFSEDPRGKVKLFSDEWWKITHAALKTATRLGIDIGMFNSPGWSQSGGPWVKPSQSMRYLSGSEVAVKGPVVFNQVIPATGPDFQDVKTIAYPVLKNYSDRVNILQALLPASAGDSSGNNNPSGQPDSVILTKKEMVNFDYNFAHNYSIRSLVIRTGRTAFKLTGELQVKNEKGVFVTTRRFLVDRSNDQLNVGFEPYAAASIAIPETVGKSFRVTLSLVAGKAVLKEINFSNTPVVDDYIEKTGAKMWQDPFPYWNAYQWKRQPLLAGSNGVIDPASVIDLSDSLTADGKLRWNVPPGNWIIERTGMLPTGVTNSPASPEGTGLEADKMSIKHIEAHFDAYLGQIIKRIPEEDRRSFKITVEDSYETGGQNWSDLFLEEFKTTYAYDPVPYLPVIHGKVVGNADKSDRFLWDMRRLIADNIAYKYVGGLREISHKYGLTTWLENYGHWGYPGEFLQYGGQSDEVGGEFWSEGDLGNIENKAASSCAHIYGKTKVSAESFTCAGQEFSRYPALMKQRGDKFFTEGINNTLLHVYVQQAYEDMKPGVNAWFGNEFNRNNTWFYDMDIFLQYIKRCNLMLQQGRYVADVAYFISEDAPKMTGTRDPALPFGYSFDYMNAEVIKTRMSVKDGRLVLPDGMNYKILVLPKLQTMRPELLEKIRELVEAGAVVLGPRPNRSPSLQNYGKADQRLAELADQLWGKIGVGGIRTNKFGKGLVIDGMDLGQALKLVEVQPDFSAAGRDSVLFIHRKLEEGELYFVSNQSNAEVEFNAGFRVGGMLPELWNPVSGITRKLPAYSSSEAGTTVPLKLAPLESAFVVFREPVAAASKAGVTNTGISKNSSAIAVNYPSPVQKIAVAKKWMVQFDKSFGGPVAPVRFDKLIDWTASINDSIRFYSGSAMYRNSFRMDRAPEGSKIMVDLGMVKAIGKVWVNGTAAGGAWTAPYKVDITGLVKKGENKIEIRVVNTWKNRLAGDSRLPATERITSTFYNNYKPESKLSPSGLLGPVWIELY